MRGALMKGAPITTVPPEGVSTMGFPAMRPLSFPAVL